MNKVISFGIYFLFSIRCFGQGYHPILEDSSVRWHMDFHYIDAFTCDEEFLFDYHMNGDTIINSLTYKKVFIENVHLYQHTTGSPNCSTPPHNHYWAAFRQDTALKRSYLIFDGDSIEKLLYDFSLNEHDTIRTIAYPPIYPPCTDTVLTITNIDTLNINGSLHLLQEIACGGFRIYEEFGSWDDPFGHS